MLDALVPLNDAPLAPWREPPSSRGLVRWPQGSASVIFALEGYDARERAAVYRLRVHNAARERLTCGLWSAGRDGALTLAYPNPIAIEALGSKDVRMLVPVDAGDPFRYAVLTVQGDGLAATFEAPGPPLHRVRRSGFAASALTIAAMIGFGSLLFFGAPRIAMLAPPPMAMAGSTLAVPYAVAGYGTVSYDLRTLDGRTLRSGTLAERAGVLPLPLPNARDERSYALAVNLRGPLGNASSERVVTATPPRTRALRVASIANVSVEPAVADAGGTLHVAYAASADRGEVRLLDDRGTVWARAPFSRSGETTLRIPAFTDSRALRVELSVQRGTSTATTASGVLVRPASAPASAPHGSDVNPIAIADGTVRGGAAIPIAIRRGMGALHLALTDDHANELVTLAVRPGTPRAELRAPLVATETTYYLVARYVGALGDESAVVPVTVMP